MTLRCNDSPEGMVAFWPEYRPTPLLDLPRLATHCGVARVLLKHEGQRFLGSFKVLGGMYAGLRALVRVLGLHDIAALLARPRNGSGLPTLLCASDGNHGLAVAAAAELAGAPARIYLPRSVPPSRTRRIADKGAAIVCIPGTYDDAVEAAAQAAERGEGLLIADTSAEENDPVVADVLAGYGLMARELVAQLGALNERPTHLFVQAGVGGLAAALAEGLRGSMTADRRIVVVEPETAACVGAALKVGHPVRLPGDLITAAGMLSCGEASAPALKILLRHEAEAVAVTEATLAEAVDTLISCGGPTTTPSGAAGLAGLLTERPRSPLAMDRGVGATSRVLLIASEGPIPLPGIAEGASA
jgi:diaminopropionate ammonia-lyase